ncbi:hypothetical protein RhiirB3_446007 [Rhizophagus irregularis]|nr:hypothetical protein RhiirB3_446007 [Rhizophagus irregularis]
MEFINDKLEKPIEPNNSITSTNLGLSYKTHSEAVYASRLLNFDNLPEPKNSDDYYERNDNIISTEFSEVIERSISDFEEHLLNEEKHEKVKLLRNINFSFLKILYEKSEVLIGKEKYWELIRGVYNCKFNTKEFWIERCNEVNEIEQQSVGIKKSDKRIRKLKDRDIESEDKNVENQKNKLKFDAKYKKRENDIK